jgi:hypothetical protein
MTCSDLLQRGGPHHVYWTEVVPKPSFAIAIKPDPNLKESRPLEPERGALFVDLQIQRLGYNGPIQLDLVSPPPGIRLWNPTIPIQAAEHRLYLTTDAGWDPQTMHLLRWIAKSTEGAQVAIPVSNLAARRTKAPHQPFPSAWMGGQFFVSGIPSTQPLFQLESQAPVPLAKLPIEQSVTVKLQRPVPDFKGPLVPLTTQAPAAHLQTPSRSWLMRSIGPAGSNTSAYRSLGTIRFRSKWVSHHPFCQETRSPYASP